MFIRTVPNYLLVMHRAPFGTKLPAEVFLTPATKQKIWHSIRMFRTTTPALVYSEKVMEHFERPKNVGTLDKKDPNVGTGMRGAAECGDMVQLQMKVNPETLVIEETKFKAFGCGSAIASSSFASEVLRGKTVAQALELTNKDIASELNLPPVKLHCSMLAEETIRAAVDNYLSKNPTLKSKVVRKKPPQGDAAPAVAGETATTAAAAAQ